MAPSTVFTEQWPTKWKTRRLFKTIVYSMSMDRRRKNVNGCAGVVLALNGEALEGRNMNDDCALNRSQKRCFITFYSILFYSYTLTFAMLFA